MDRNPFHFAHLDASDASLSGIAVAYEFHEACRDASTPPVLAILQTCLQNLKWSHILAMSSSRWICNLPTIIGNRFANHTATPKVVPADSLAERTELTPSRLFSSARRNCSRDGSYRQLPAGGLQITSQCRSQPRWSRPLSPTTFVIVTNQKCQLYHKKSKLWQIIQCCENCFQVEVKIFWLYLEKSLTQTTLFWHLKTCFHRNTPRH